jgi:dCMP deaminase
VGKSTIAEFLIQQGFTRLHLTASNAPVDANLLKLEKLKLSGKVVNDKNVFEDAEELLNFVTANWSENYVTTDIYDDEIAEIFLKRPFFLLVGVGAPIASQFQRFSSR